MGVGLSGGLKTLSGMAQNFLSCDRDQVFLLPPDVGEWLPADHLARFVIEAVDELDLSEIYGYYRQDGLGRPAHDPAMMGRIQAVVATLNVEELRCREEAVL